MKCDDSEELLIGYALDQLDPVRTVQLREHLNEGCRACARKLNELVETWSMLGEKLEPVPPSPEVEVKLLAMVREQVAPPAGSLAVGESHSERFTRVLSYALAACLVGIAAAVLAWRFTPLERIIAHRGETVAPREVWATSPTNESLTGFQTVALNPVAERQGVRLSVVMIPQSREWHVIARGLPNVDRDEKFQLWLEIKSGEFQKLAVLSVEKTVRGGVIIDSTNIDMSDVAGIWLTLESESDGTRPSENVLFRATLK